MSIGECSNLIRRKHCKKSMQIYEKILRSQLYTISFQASVIRPLWFMMLPGFTMCCTAPLVTRL